MIFKGREYSSPVEYQWPREDNDQKINNKFIELIQMSWFLVNTKIIFRLNTKRRWAKTTFSTKYISYMRKSNLSQQKYWSIKKIYKRIVPNYLNVRYDRQPKLERSRRSPHTTRKLLPAIIQQLSPQVTIIKYDSPIAHTTEVKFLNKRHTTLVTNEFKSSNSQNAVKY